MSMEYRPLQPAEEPEFFDIIAHALSITGASWQTFQERIGGENLRAVLNEGRLVGGLGIYRMGQWFGGRVVPCGGVSIVGMTPESRGRGIARSSLVAMLGELQSDGTPLACLYPSTQRFYRSVGFEQAGSYCRYKLPLDAINCADRELPVTRLEGDAPASFSTIASQRGRLTNGNIDRTAGMWQRVTCHPDKPMYNGLIGSHEDPQGYICYRNDASGNETVIHVTDMAALTPAAMRRLWTLLADHRSIPTHVSWTGPPTDPLLAIPQECKWIPVKMMRWMLRIVDVKKCLESRGYPIGVTAELHLDVTDDQLPENNGRFILSVSHGEGHVTAGGNGDLRLNVRALAPLFSSFLSADALRSLGWLEGDQLTLQSASTIFAGPEPWMPESF